MNDKLSAFYSHDTDKQPTLQWYALLWLDPPPSVTYTDFVDLVIDNLTASMSSFSGSSTFSASNRFCSTTTSYLDVTVLETVANNSKSRKRVSSRREIFHKAFPICRRNTSCSGHNSFSAHCATGYSAFLATKKDSNKVVGRKASSMSTSTAVTCGIMSFFSNMAFATAFSLQCKSTTVYKPKCVSKRTTQKSILALIPLAAEVVLASSSDDSALNPTFSLAKVLNSSSGQSGSWNK